MCIDAIQFSDPPVAALRECRRILARGGRLAVTAWEPRGPFPEGVPERIRRMNLARHLLEAGFEQIEVTEKPDWYAAERTLWEAALQADASGALAAFDVRRRGWQQPPRRPEWHDGHPPRKPEHRNRTCQPFRRMSDLIAE